MSRLGWLAFGLCLSGSAWAAGAQGWAWALAAALALDAPLERASARWGAPGSGWAVVNAWGGAPGMAVAAAWWGTGVLAERQRWAEEGARMTRAAVVGVGAAWAAKRLTGRRRPDDWAAGTGDPWRWGAGGDAFPSGHATVAFALSTAWAEGRPRSRAARTAAYALATGTALARVRYRRHWLSDVVAGAALGVAVGRWSVRRGARWTATPTALGWSWSW